MLDREIFYLDKVETFRSVVCNTKVGTRAPAHATSGGKIMLAFDCSIVLLHGLVFRDINKALRVARAVETGRMWVNTYNQIPEGAPFGGYKQSGIGRETHKMILDHYTQVKNIMINLSEAPSGFYPQK